MTYPIVILTALALLIPASANADCGEERAAVKLGLDADARRIALQPVPVTIAELVLRPAPRHPPANRRATDEHGTERTVYRVAATITVVKLEDDQDFHIVLVDPAGNHMIVEAPSPECAANGAWPQQIATVRAALEAKLHPTKKMRRVSIPVTVTGVGFFDKVHGQVGVARPSGVELHPLLSIEFGDSTRRD